MGNIHKLISQSSKSDTVSMQHISPRYSGGNRQGIHILLKKCCRLNSQGKISIFLRFHHSRYPGDRPSIFHWTTEELRQGNTRKFWCYHSKIGILYKQHILIHCNKVLLGNRRTLKLKGHRPSSQDKLRIVCFGYPNECQWGREDNDHFDKEELIRGNTRIPLKPDSKFDIHHSSHTFFHWNKDIQQGNYIFQFQDCKPGFQGRSRIFSY